MSNEKPKIEVYPATALDHIDLLRPIIEDSIKDSLTGITINSEVENVIRNVESSQKGDLDTYYAFAKDLGGNVLGLMGLQTPSEEMRKLAISRSPFEIINAFVLGSTRGSGIGKTLVEHMHTRVLNSGSQEIMVNSGPRYRLTGWPFWTKLYGDPIGKITDYYGPSLDAMVWRKILANKKN